MEDRTVYNYEKLNVSDNPNSALMTLFEHDLFFNHDAHASLQVLSTLIKNSVFDSLRTKEQLGYIV